MDDSPTTEPQFSRKLPPNVRFSDSVLAKWSDRALAEGYVPFPKRLLRLLARMFQGEDSIEELMVILAIADYQRVPLNHPPSLQRLAFTADLPVDRFRQLVTKLEDRGWLTVSGDDSRLTISIERFLTEMEKLDTISDDGDASF